LKRMTRREFVKAGAGLAAVVSGLEMITGCTTMVNRSIQFNKIIYVLTAHVVSHKGLVNNHGSCKPNNWTWPRTEDFLVR